MPLSNWRHLNYHHLWIHRPMPPNSFLISLLIMMPIVQMSFESTLRVCSKIIRQPWFFHFQSYSWWPNSSVRINFHWWKSWTSRRWLIAGQTSPNCIFLASVCADQVYLVSFRTIQQAGRGHPCHFCRFLTKTTSYSQKLRFLWPYVNLLQFLECWSELSPSVGEEWLI